MADYCAIRGVVPVMDGEIVAAVLVVLLIVLLPLWAGKMHLNFV